VLTCSSLFGDGIKNVWNTVREHRSKFINTGEFYEKRKQQSLDWMWALVDQGLKDRFYNNVIVKKHISVLLKAVENKEKAPLAAANELLALLD
jgi:LAO/AO transport system kinase